MKIPLTTNLSRGALVALAIGSSLLAGTTAALADGSETLGAPVGITLAAGSGLAVGGVGLSDTNAGSLNVVLPTNAAIRQVLLYWHGASDALGGDAAIKVGTNAVTGTLIGGPTQIFPGVMESAYRADITGLGLVGAGTNTLGLSEVDFSEFNNGAGVLVIYSNAAPAAIALVDGDDFALENYLSPLNKTEPQRFSIMAAKTARTAQLALLVGGSEGRSTIRIWTGGQHTTFTNALTSSSGAAWDSVVLPVTIPAGATNVTVQLISGDGSHAPGESSLISWVGAALAVPPGHAAESNRPPRVAIYQADRTFCARTNGTSRVHVHGLVSDADCDTLAVDWFVNGAKVETDTVVIPSARPQQVELIHNFPQGTNRVYAKVSDGTNTVFSSTNQVVVALDNVPPVISCKELKNKKANPHGVAHLPGVAVYASDNCTPRHRLVKTQEPHPGTPLPVGTHLVTVTVTDQAGNVSTCTTEFTVTLHKAPKPPGKPGKVKPVKSKPMKVKKH